MSITTFEGCGYSVYPEHHWHHWKAECFDRMSFGNAPTEAEAKAAALAWIADTLREVPARAAAALGVVTGKAARLPSQILADHIALRESMRAQISEAPDCERKPLDLARLDGAIASLRMAKTAIEAPSSLTSAPESAALSETPPAAIERPVGLVWLADTVPGER